LGLLETKRNRLLDPSICIGSGTHPLGLVAFFSPPLPRRRRRRRRRSSSSSGGGGITTISLWHVKYGRFENSLYQVHEFRSTVMSARVLLQQARRLSTCGAPSAKAPVQSKRNILDLSFEDLAGEMAKLDQPSYRARQLWTYIYNKLGTSFDHVPSFPTGLKEQVGACPERTVRAQMFHALMLQQLKDSFVVGGGERGDAAAVGCVSSDGTRKWKMATVKGARQQLNAQPPPPPPSPHPGGVVEAVYIPEKKRGTLCVSSQVGCSMKCSFCATGAMSKASLRNLTSGEIVSVLVYNNNSALISACRWSKCCRRDCLALSPLYFTTLSPLFFTSHTRHGPQARRLLSAAASDAAPPPLHSAGADTEDNDAGCSLRRPTHISALVQGQPFRVCAPSHSDRADYLPGQSRISHIVMMGMVCGAAAAAATAAAAVADVCFALRESLYTTGET
jgi:hypothetical protein